MKSSSCSRRSASVGGHELFGEELPELLTVSEGASEPFGGPITGSFDLASPADQERVRQLADAVLARGAPPYAPGDPSGPLDARIAMHLAESKAVVQRLDWDGTLAVVFAMWGEQRRLRPRSDSNPAGEDALHTKLDQLAWLFEGSRTQWLVYPVDDGDPDDSAVVAIERAAEHREGRRVSVLRLTDEVPTDTGPLASLGHVDDSRKGGAIVWGAATAVAEGCDAVVLTDADNSVNLAQMGLLVGPFRDGYEVVVGDRKHPDSALVKAEARWGPGIVVLRHMQRMVGRALFAGGLRDTQAAFKLYGRAALDDILRGEGFFDIENHPEIVFTSTGYEELSENTGRLTGDLSVAGVVKPVTLDVVINKAEMNQRNRREMIGFSASGTLSRADFGMTQFNNMVADELSLNVQVEFRKIR